MSMTGILLNALELRMERRNKATSIPCYSTVEELSNLSIMAESAFEVVSGQVVVHQWGLSYLCVRVAGYVRVAQKIC